MMGQLIFQIYLSRNGLTVISHVTMTEF